MNKSLILRLATLIGAMCLPCGVALSAEPSSVKTLADGRLQIGQILVDKNASTFTLPGRVIRQDAIDAPMEFIAVTKDGVKSYEAILGLDASAVDFNLACILIGLDEAKARRPTYHFDPSETLGDPVSIDISFSRNGEQHSFPVEQLLGNHAKTGPHQWTYTGSSFSADGSYLAEAVGTLIGFVHDPESIIQHRKGLGLGNYGEVVLDPAVVPDADTPVTLTVRRR